MAMFFDEICFRYFEAGHLVIISSKSFLNSNHRMTLVMFSNNVVLVLQFSIIKQRHTPWVFTSMIYG